MTVTLRFGSPGLQVGGIGGGVSFVGLLAGHVQVLAWEVVALAAARFLRLVRVVRAWLTGRLTGRQSRRPSVSRGAPDGRSADRQYRDPRQLTGL